jgi:hypothetical protein
MAVMSTELQTRVDALVAGLATRQHGVVARRQLIALGVTGHGVKWRLATGRLHQVHRGVYAVGHMRLTREARWMAAVLAGGKGAVLSHKAAAGLWGLLPAPAKAEVTVARVLRRRDAIVFHFGRLPADEITHHDDVPVTTVARTLLDIAAARNPRLFERALNEAEYRRLYDEVGLSALIARYPDRRGVPLIRSRLANLIGITRLELEECFIAFVDSFALARPELNVPLELAPGRWIEVDCLWHDARLIVELDSRAAHATSSRFDSDRERDRLLAVAGWRVVRVTWAHLRDAPERLAADLRRLLTRL